MISMRSIFRQPEIFMPDTTLERSILRGHKDAVICISRSGNSSILASSSDDRTARVWDIRTKMSAIRLVKLPESSGDIGTCRVSEHSVWVSSGSSLFSFDLRASKSIVLTQPSATYSSADQDDYINDFDIMGRSIAIPTDSGKIRLISTTDMRETSAVQSHSNIAAACRFLPSGSNMVSGGYDCNVATMKLDSAGALVERTFPIASLIPIDQDEQNNPSQSVNPPFVTCIDVSNDQLVFGSGDGSVVVTDLKKGGSRIENRRIAWGGACVHPVSVSSVAFGDNGSVWSGGNDSVLINMSDTQINVRYPIGFKPNSVVSLGDGRVAVGGLSNEIHLLYFR